MSWYCQFPSCPHRATWRDDDTGLRYCEDHATSLIAFCDHLDRENDESKQKRADFADEYARDAAREAARS